MRREIDIINKRIKELQKQLNGYDEQVSNLAKQSEIVKRLIRELDLIKSRIEDVPPIPVNPAQGYIPCPPGPAVPFNPPGPE